MASLEPSEVTEPLPALPTPEPYSTLAVVSLVLGLLSACVLPLVGAVGAIITGHLARREIRRTDGVMGGRGLALAGLTLGYLFLFVPGCVAVGVVAFGDNIVELFRTSSASSSPSAAGPPTSVSDSEEEAAEEAAPESLLVTRVVLNQETLRVDDEAVWGVPAPSPQSNLGELPALLRAFRLSRQRVGTDTLRIEVSEDVSYGLLSRVLQTASSAKFETVGLVMAPGQTEPYWLWDGDIERLELPPQSPFALYLRGNEVTVEVANEKWALRRDNPGGWSLDALDEALMAILGRMPQQQTAWLHVQDEAQMKDVLAVLEACAFAGVSYVALRNLDER